LFLIRHFLAREIERMKTRTKRLITVVIILCLVGCTLAGWTAVKVFAWIVDLPNRIVVDGDGLATAFGSAVVLSYHQGLSSGDVETQSQILSGFASLIGNDEAGKEWVRTDIRQLTSSPNANVASLAANLLTLLSESQESAPRQSTEQKRSSPSDPFLE
jgi:hypothetical protein